ncbi:875_t:CDS:2, partial [Gigaspora rosea]
DLSRKAKALAKEAVSPFYRAKSEKYWALYEKFCKRFELDADNPQEEGVLAFIMWLDIIGLVSQTLQVLQVVINNLRFKGREDFKKSLAVMQVLRAVRKERLINGLRYGRTKLYDKGLIIHAHTWILQNHHVNS